MATINPIAFLDTEPPSDPSDAKRLFVDREEELRQAKRYVEAARDLDPNRILAITGRARVGKSHLLKVTEAEVSEYFSATISIQITPGHGRARDVLREILSQVFEGLHAETRKQGIRAPNGKSILNPFERLYSVYSDAISGLATSVEVTQINTITTSLKRRIGATFKLPKLLALIGGPEIGVDAQREDATGTNKAKSKKIVVNAFQRDTLGLLINLLHTLVVSERSNWKTLLIIDDFDILHRTRDGSFNPMPLMQELYNLSRVPGFYVLTTVREDTYYQHEKTFVRIAYVEPFSSIEFLIEAYQRRVAHYYGGTDPIGEELISDFAQRADGRIGVFIRYLREVYDHRVTVPHEWFKNIWKRLEKEESEVTGLVKKAVAEQDEEPVRENAARLLPTGVYRFLLEDYSSINSLVVDPIASSFIRRILEEEQR